MDRDVLMHQMRERFEEEFSKARVSGEKENHHVGDRMPTTWADHAKPTTNTCQRFARRYEFFDDHPSRQTD